MKPNIILIVADSLRYDHVGSIYGSISLTPNLDNISQKAINFSQAISQGPSTRVSMSALMSSTYASMYGGEKTLSKTRPVIQNILQDVGYQTAGITTNLYTSGEFGWNRGFDYFDDCMPEYEYHRRLGIRFLNKITKRIGLPLVWPKSLPAKSLFRSARSFLQSAKSPFFIWMQLMDTHWPYTIQNFSWNPSNRKKANFDQEIYPRLLSETPNLTDSEREQLIKEYKDAVIYTDLHIGIFYKYLTESNISRDTWLVITADHGEEFFEHGRFFHHPTLYENLIHVPLIIRPPDTFALSQGKDNYCSQVRLIDLVPTFLDIAQISPPPGFDMCGSSLYPILKDPSIEDPRHAIIESPSDHKVLAIRLDGWKYIWDIKEGKHMLFNLNNDPNETRNIANNFPDIVYDLHIRLEEHIQLTNTFMTDGDNSTDNGELSAEIIERLRGLGYIE